MRQLVFFICATFAVKENGAAVNSFSSEIGSPTFPTPYANESIAEENARTKNETNLDQELLQIIANATNRFSGEHSKLISELIALDKKLEGGISEALNLENELRSIFDQNNNITEFHEKSECIALFDNMINKIYDHKRRSWMCALNASQYSEKLVSDAKRNYEDVTAIMRNFHLLASICSDECLKIKKILINSFTDLKLEKMTTQFRIFNEDALENMKKLNSCVHSNETITKYERDVKEDFANVRNCLRQETKKEFDTTIHSVDDKIESK